MIKKRIISLFSIIIILSMISGIRYYIFDLNKFAIGKEITIVVPENIDYNEVIDPKKTSYNSIGDLLNKERKKLAIYMKKNNYMILAGTYIINTKSPYIDLKKKLRFAKDI